MKNELSPLITTSAPGSLMLLDEYAVPHGHRSLVCAINRRIIVELTPTVEETVEIFSALGHYTSPLYELVDHSSFKLVLQTVMQYRDRAPSGFRLKITSGFWADIEFGSSSAVTVAIHAALMKWIDGQEPSAENLFTQSLKTGHAVLKRDSDAGLAASVFGGVVDYRTKPDVYLLELAIPLTVVFCGYKTVTETILKDKHMRATPPEKYARIYTDSEDSIDKAIACLKNRDWATFGQLLNRNQQLMDEMRMNTSELQEIVTTLQKDSGILGAKISGAGIENYAIGMGYAKQYSFNYPVYHLEISQDGCQYHD